MAVVAVGLQKRGFGLSTFCITLLRATSISAGLNVDVHETNDLDIVASCLAIVVMDPISALSLAANILQFIDFTSKLFSAGYQMHQAGTSQLELDLGLVVRDLGDASRNLKASLNPPGVHVVLTSDDQVRNKSSH